MSLYHYVNKYVNKSDGGGQLQKAPNASDIETGLNPTEIGSKKSGLSALKKIQKLPNTTTDAAILKADENAGKLAANAYKLNKLAQNRLKAARSLQAIVRTQATFQKGMMAIDTSMTDTLADFGIATAEYSLDKSSSQHNYSGYMDEYNAGSSQIEGMLDF